MDIKKASESLIKQVVSETTSPPTAPSVVQKTSLGLGGVKDGIESSKPNPFGSIIATPAAKNPFAEKMQESKAEIGKFLSGQGSFQSGFPAMGGLFDVMMQYQKMMNKEHREDRTATRADAKSELALKQNKLELESQKIGEMKTEAGERFDNAMSSAMTQMALGIASGFSGLASALPGAGRFAEKSGIKSITSELKQHAGSVKSELLQKPESDAAAIDVRYRHLISWLDDKDK